MPQRSRAALVIAAVIAITGCSGSTTTATGTPAAKVAASASAPPGCAQATAAVRAARDRINAQDYAGAVNQITDLRDTVPSRKLKIDAALAATDLAFLNYDVTAGEPVYQAIKDAYASLDKISADCGA